MMHLNCGRLSHRIRILVAAFVLGAVPHTSLSCDATEARSSTLSDDESLDDRARRSVATDESEPQSTGETLFRQRCAKCHDGIPGIPTRMMLAKLSKDYLVDALTKGLMIDQAIGLSDSEIDALAGYVSGEGR